jgi:DUF1680 family protein
VEPSKAGEFDLHIRVPGWCQRPGSSDDLYQPDHRPQKGAARLKVNGKMVENLEVIRGYVNVRRRWKSGDILQLALDMPVQRLKANVRLEAAKGRVALMRGPVVYCFEGADNGAAVQNLVISPGTDFTPKYERDLLGGVTVLAATATGVFKTPANQLVSVPFPVMATPYYANANRGTCPMQVWMPEQVESCSPQGQE